MWEEAAEVSSDPRSLEVMGPCGSSSQRRKKRLGAFGFGYGGFEVPENHEGRYPGECNQGLSPLRVLPQA